MIQRIKCHQRWRFRLPSCPSPRVLQVPLSTSSQTKPHDPDRIYEVAARNLREYHGVPSMTPDVKDLPRPPHHGRCRHGGKPCGPVRRRMSFLHPRLEFSGPPPPPPMAIDHAFPLVCHGPRSEESHPIHGARHMREGGPERGRGSDVRHRGPGGHRGCGRRRRCGNHCGCPHNGCMT